MFSAVLFNLCAWQNTYKSSDPEYRNLMILKTMSGVNLPDVTTPVSAEQMKNLLETIDAGKLNGRAREIYDNLYEELCHPDVLFKFNDVGGDLKFALLPFEVIGNLGDKTSTGFYRDVISRYDLYDLDASLFISKNFYGRMVANGSKIEGKEKSFSDGNFIFNSVFQPDGISQAWPDIAFGSAGNGTLNLIVGRDRLSAGNGMTGNMYLSENRKYDDFAKFSAVSYPLAYDFTTVMYDGFTKDSDFENGDYKLRTTDFDDPKKVLFIHRFSATVLKKITLSAYEGAVIYGDDMWSDVRALNPFMFIHNNGTYYTGNTNNFAGIEIDAAICQGVNANLQIMVDQFKLSSEKANSGETQYGILANANGAWNKGKGVLTAYVEGVYASKGLYLKELSNKNFGYNYNDNEFFFAQTDMVTGNKRFSGEKDELAYLGYPDGGDLAKFSIGAAYILENMEFDVDAAITAKGVYGIGKNEVRVQTNKAERGHSSTQYCYSLALTAKGTFFKGIDCCATLSGFAFNNYLHEKNSDKAFVQVSLGCKIDPTLLFIKRKQL